MLHAWEKIAEQIEQLRNHRQIGELVQKLNRAMTDEEREKVVEHCLGVAPQVLFVLKNKSSGTR